MLRSSCGVGCAARAEASICSSRACESFWRRALLGSLASTTVLGDAGVAAPMRRGVCCLRLRPALPPGVPAALLGPAPLSGFPMGDDVSALRVPGVASATPRTTTDGDAATFHAARALTCPSARASIRLTRLAGALRAWLRTWAGLDRQSVNAQWLLRRSACAASKLCV